MHTRRELCACSLCLTVSLSEGRRTGSAEPDPMDTGNLACTACWSPHIGFTSHRIHRSRPEPCDVLHRALALAAAGQILPSWLLPATLTLLPNVFCLSSDLLISMPQTATCTLSHNPELRVGAMHLRLTSQSCSGPRSAACNCVQSWRPPYAHTHVRNCMQ